MGIRVGRVAFVQVLKQLPFLQNMSTEIFRRLLQRGELVKYQRGEVMWQPPSGLSPPPSPLPPRHHKHTPAPLSSFWQTSLPLRYVRVQMLSRCLLPVHFPGTSNGLQFSLAAGYQSIIPRPRGCNSAWLQEALPLPLLPVLPVPLCSQLPTKSTPSDRKWQIGVLSSHWNLPTVLAQTVHLPHVCHTVSQGCVHMQMRTQQGMASM